MVLHIILDLDGTLIHTQEMVYGYEKYINYPSPNFTFKLKNPETGKYHSFHCHKRPYLDLFIEFLFNSCATVSVWTTATRLYADIIIRNIFTKKQISELRFIYSRNKTNRLNNSNKYMKILNNVFKEYPDMNQNNTILIDDDVTHLNTPNIRTNILISNKYEG